MDDSDITKRYAKKMEYLDRVRDGSENKITDGYNTVNICFSSRNKKHPIPLVSSIWSSKEPGFASRNVEYFSAIKKFTIFLVKRASH